MKFTFSSAATLGARDNQEDAIACSSEVGGKGALMIVADGMGGYEGGEIASALAANAFADTFRNHTRGSIPQRLKMALVMANHALAERIQMDPELDGMGTTLLAAYVDEDGLYWASVGDSLLILVRDGEASRLNEDHSMTPVIERQVLAGLITRKQADLHPEHGTLLACLGGLRAPDLLDCPLQHVTLHQGDKIIVASDGILCLMSGEIAQACTSASDLLSAVAAKNLPEQDNASAVMLELG